VESDEDEDKDDDDNEGDEDQAHKGTEDNHKDEHENADLYADP
jgi:hypothetical protein